MLSDSSISRTPRDPEVSKTEVRLGPSLGAIPKRRSPRQLAKARKPDVERLARLKNINFNKNLHEAEHTVEVCHSASRVELMISREGKETLDIIKNLAVMNLKSRYRGDSHLLFWRRSVQNRTGNETNK